MLDTGRAFSPHAHRRKAFAGISTGTEEHLLRVAEPGAGRRSRPPGHRPGAHRGDPAAEEVRLVLDEPGFPVSFDLRYHARFGPVATEPNRIELRGEVVTDYMNFFQSGVYPHGRRWTAERTVTDRRLP